MDAPNTSAPQAAAGSSIDTSWAGSALVLTVIVGAVASAFGLLIAPGMQGVASQTAMDGTEIGSMRLKS